MWLIWKNGRQESGYRKMLLATFLWPVPFDFYLLYYPEGSSIDWHKDPSKPGFEHHRINLVIWQSQQGAPSCKGMGKLL